MDASPPAIIEPYVTRSEYDALCVRVDELHGKLDHLIELSKLNAEALDWLVKTEKADRKEATNGGTPEGR